MYIPNAFAVNNTEEIHAFINANAFGQLISTVEGRPYSTHLPFLLSNDKSKVIGHLARQNPQANNIEGQEVLVSLQGDHAYISPSWYESPGVPTWNYQAVHIYGKCTVFNDTNKLQEVVNTLTQKYESDFDTPWEPSYNKNMLNAIVGIEIEISEFQCNFKLSQNRSAADQEKVIKNLSSHGSQNLATTMKHKL